MKREMREVLDAATSRVAARPAYLISPDVAAELADLRGQRGEPMFVVDSGKEKMIAVARHAALRLCAYGGGRCDCKYGATAIGSMHEVGNGCPEMNVIALMLDVMTDAEYARILKRAKKNASRAPVAPRLEHRRRGK